MATVTKPQPLANDRGTGPEQDGTPGDPGVTRARPTEPEVFWGDWLALRLWCAGCALMWLWQVLDLVAGFWRK